MRAKSLYGKYLTEGLLGLFIKKTKLGNYDINCTVYSSDNIPVATFSETWDYNPKVKDFFEYYLRFKTNEVGELARKRMYAKVAKYAKVFTTPAYAEKVFTVEGYEDDSIDPETLPDFDDFWKENITKYNAEIYSYETSACKVVAFRGQPVSEGADVSPEPNKTVLINKAKQNIGNEYHIEQAGWQGDHWQNEWGEIEEKGIRRHMGDDDEYGFLDTWNDIDVYVLEEILNNILEK